MIKIKPFLIATLLLTGFALPAVAQIGEARNNLSVGINGGVNLNSASFTPTIKQNSLMGITGGLTARYISEKYFAMICGAIFHLYYLATISFLFIPLLSIEYGSKAELNATKLHEK